MTGFRWWQGVILVILAAIVSGAVAWAVNAHRAGEVRAMIDSQQDCIEVSESVGKLSRIAFQWGIEAREAQYRAGKGR